MEFIKSFRKQLTDDLSVASQTVAAYTCILDEVIRDVAMEVHREVHTGLDDSQQAVTGRERMTLPLSYYPPARTNKGAVDVFGQLIPAVAEDRVNCPACGNPFAASRFAQHLEKCLGGGRKRAASRRIAGREA
ncbi:hypothetical protein WJX72_012096 [[Myrmecia] bisecta]|uniref:SAGA-associated factor 11 n=1 Tax=[Myrmecia] bisecta TaxID=41462 RepID=A0AAW1PZP8_9CHLO